MSAAAKSAGKAKKSGAVKKDPPREEPWQARQRILCGRQADWSISDGHLKTLVTQHDEAAREGDEKRCKEIRAQLTNRRFKNRDWTVADEDGELYSSIKQGANLAVMLDIRDRLLDLQEVMISIRKKLPAGKRKNRAGAAVEA